MLVLVTIIEICLMIIFNSLNLTNNRIVVEIIIIIFTLFYALALSNDSKLSNVNSQITMGLFFRVGLLFFDIYGKRIFNLPNSGLDSEGFYRSSVLVARNTIIPKYGVFPNLMGILMKFVGTSRLYAQYIIVVFSLFALVFIAYSLYEMNVKDSVQRHIMCIVSLLPNFAILGSIYLRESAVTICIAISCYMYTLWITRKNELCFLGAFLFVLLGALFHSGTIGLLVGYLAARIFYDNNEERIRIRISNIAIVVTFLIAFVYILNNYGDVFLVKMNNVDTLEDIANTQQLGDSSYASYVGDSSSLINLIIYTPVRIAYFLLSPLPWQWRGGFDMIAFFFSSLFFLFVLGRTIREYFVCNNIRRNEILVWMVVTLSITFVFAWGVSNAGTAMRHRDKLIPLFAILLGLDESNIQHNKVSTPMSKYIKGN